MTLETEHFEDYLSFLTEVLELNVREISDLSMRLDLQSTWIEIKRVMKVPHQVSTLVEFTLDAEEYGDMVQKISFFYYRKGPCRFLFIHSDDNRCQIVDPDGREWRFTREYQRPKPFSKSISLHS